MARETFAAVKKKWLKIQISQRYKLADAAQAHRDLEGAQDHGRIGHLARLRRDSHSARLK